MHMEKYLVVRGEWKKRWLGLLLVLATCMKRQMTTLILTENMVMDAMRMNQGNVSQCPIVEEEPNADAARFFDLLKDSDEPL